MEGGGGVKCLFRTMFELEFLKILNFLNYFLIILMC
jgi:hypothetical protein